MLLALFLSFSCAFQCHFPHSTCSCLQRLNLTPTLTGRDLKPHLPAGLCSFQTLLFYSRNEVWMHTGYKTLGTFYFTELLRDGRGTERPFSQPVVSLTPRAQLCPALIPHSPLLDGAFSHAPYPLTTLRTAQRLFSSYTKTSTGKAAPTCAQRRREAQPGSARLGAIRPRYLSVQLPQRRHHQLLQLRGAGPRRAVGQLPAGKQSGVGTRGTARSGALRSGVLRTGGPAGSSAAPRSPAPAARRRPPAAPLAPCARRRPPLPTAARRGRGGAELQAGRGTELREEGGPDDPPASRPGNVARSKR